MEGDAPSGQKSNFRSAPRAIHPEDFVAKNSDFIHISLIYVCYTVFIADPASLPFLRPVEIPPKLRRGGTCAAQEAWPAPPRKHTGGAARTSL